MVPFSHEVGPYYHQVSLGAVSGLYTFPWVGAWLGLCLSQRCTEFTALL